MMTLGVSDHWAVMMYGLFFITRVAFLTPFVAAVGPVISKHILDGIMLQVTVCQSDVLVTNDDEGV